MGEVLGFRETMVQQLDANSSASWQAFPSSGQEDEWSRGVVDKAQLAVVAEGQLGRLPRPLALTEDVKEQLLLQLVREQAATNRKLDSLIKTGGSGGGGRHSTSSSSQQNNTPNQSSKGSWSKGSSPRRQSNSSRSSPRALVKTEPLSGRHGVKMPAADDPNGCFSCWAHHRPHDHPMASCNIKPWGSFCIKCMRRDGLKAKDVRGTDKEKKYLHKELSSCG